MQHTKFERFDVFKAVRIYVHVFWVVMQCIVVVGYQRFGGPCCLHLQDEHTPLKSRTYHNTTRRHNAEEIDFRTN